MIVVLIVAGAAVAFILLAVAMRWDDRRERHRDPWDGYGLTVNAGEAESLGYGERPPEIAHEPPAWTSPAAPSPPAPARERPGAAAAAHVDPNPPGSVPPPLPDPAYAAAHPTAWPLAWLESDTFVDGFTAIRDHGDWDTPTAAPGEWHAELRAEGLEA